MEDVTMDVIYRWVLLLIVIHAVGSQLAGIVWQNYSPYDEIDELDLKAMRVLWFVFLPLGLAAMAFVWLDSTFPVEMPIPDKDWTAK